MFILCVDDEQNVLDRMTALCGGLPGITGVCGFSSGAEALRWMEENRCGIALLDICMPDMDGLVLARHIREMDPDTRIIFVTNHPEYAVDAFRLHVTGYLLKPVTADRLLEEVGYALTVRPVREVPHIEIKTFGGFDVAVDGETVLFARGKSKELLAILVDRQGQFISRAKIGALLWEGRDYDRSMQKQLDVIVRSLRDTLNKYGISEVFEMQKGMLRVVPETFTCDLYRYLDGDTDAVNAYSGEYMNAYSWASITEAYMDRVYGNF